MQEHLIRKLSYKIYTADAVYEAIKIVNKDSFTPDDISHVIEVALNSTPQEGMNELDDAITARLKEGIWLEAFASCSKRMQGAGYAVLIEVPGIAKNVLSPTLLFNGYKGDMVYEVSKGRLLLPQNSFQDLDDAITTMSWFTAIFGSRDAAWDFREYARRLSYREQVLSNQSLYKIIAPVEKTGQIHLSYAQDNGLVLDCSGKRKHLQLVK